MSHSRAILDQRRAGILLHPTSLPGHADHGDFGHEAYRFIEFLAASGITVWQTLPLGPTHEDNSPYQCLSVHAGNPLLISLDWLVDRGWLSAHTLLDEPVNASMRRGCLQIARIGFEANASQNDRYHYDNFVKRSATWLNDYALYSALRQNQGNSHWTDWLPIYRDRQPAALEKACQALSSEIEQVKFEQFVFFTQWSELKTYAHRHQIMIFGDMPIFVAHDSAEVWAHREYFTIDEHGSPEVVAGVPPDYFSETGQRWGNPLYHWERMQAEHFDWWIRRMHTQLTMFDLIRIDHFRGFEACWEIPVSSDTAIGGRWVKAPGEALLATLYKHFDHLPLVAEDLGVITPEVNALRQLFQLPGMKILQFAFDGNANNPYLPHNHERNMVAYTGTHDNDTTLSWYQSLAIDEKTRVNNYLGNTQESMPWALNRCVLASVARLAILPMQDILGLGQGNRMNVPGTVSGNWQWRYQPSQMSTDLPQRLRRMLGLYGRLKD